MDKSNIIFVSTSGLSKVDISSNRVLGLTKELSKMNYNIYLTTVRRKEFPFNIENNFSYCKKLIIIQPLSALTFMFNILRKLYKKISNSSSHIKTKSNDVSGGKKASKIEKFRDKFMIFSHYIPGVGFIPPSRVVKAIESNINLKEFPRTILFTTQPPLICHEVGIRLKQKYKSNIFWVADYRDLVKHYMQPDLEISKKADRLNILTLKSADLIVTVSEGLKELLLKDSIGNGFNIEDKIIVINNGFDDSISNNYYQNNIHLYSKIRIVHTGRLYRGLRNPKTLFKAISLLSKNTREKIEIISAGPDEKLFLQYARELNVLDNVKSLGFITKEKALNLQESASILLVIKFNDDEEGILTGKFFEYLRLKKPIIVIGDRDNEFNRLAQKIGGIKIFGYNQSEELSIFLDKCVQSGNKNLSLLFGQPNEKEIMKFKWENLAKKLIRKIESKLNSYSEKSK